MSSAIVVFSHVRWNWVYQRPQQLLSRLAKDYRVVFIEEPHFQPGGTWMKTWSPAQNILVCQPQTPLAKPGFHDDHLPFLKEMLPDVVGKETDLIAWFYTPMALPLLQEFTPRLVIYDCMDELSAFRHAPRQLLQRENALMKLADLVFTAGRQLHVSKCNRHPNIHCFPGSVDCRHFLPALDRSNSHPLHRKITGPRLGFCGVIDERFDAELVARLADAHSLWQIVLVGPVAKIDPAILPRRANIHYMGQQPYAALPQFLAGWDVCLLPFACNEATRYINPIKTLEYMAAELPIVSTPVAEVVQQYGDVVSVAGDPASFIAACEQALLASPAEHARRVRKMRRILASTSWDKTVEEMRALITSTGYTGLKPVVVPQPDEVALHEELFAGPGLGRSVEDQVGLTGRAVGL